MNLHLVEMNKDRIIRFGGLSNGPVHLRLTYRLDGNLLLIPGVWEQIYSARLRGVNSTSDESFLFVHLFIGFGLFEQGLEI